MMQPDLRQIPRVSPGIRRRSFARKKKDGAETGTASRVWGAAFIALALSAYCLRKPDSLTAAEPWLPAQLLWLSAYLVAAAGIFFRWPLTSRVMRASLPLILLLIIVSVSVFWSGDPGTTARRAIALIGTSVVALFFAFKLSLRALAESYFAAVVIGAILSAVLIVLVPSYGLQHGGYEGAWQGIYYGKNELGQVMALGIITGLALLGEAQKKRRGTIVACLVFFGILLVGSRSAGAIASAAILGIGLAIFLRLRAARSRAVVTRAVVGIVAATLLGLALGLGPALLALLGRDATLTGRTDVWQSAFTAISERPILGYGYREFWDPDGDARFFIAPNEDGWLADTAHNGFIEVALDTGVVGEVTLIAFIVLVFRRTLRMCWERTDVLSAWPLLICGYVVLENLSDRSFLTQDNLSWILFLASFFFAVRNMFAESDAYRIVHNPKQRAV